MTILKRKRRFHRSNLGVPNRGKVVDVIKFAGITIFRWKVADYPEELESPHGN